MVRIASLFTALSAALLFSACKSESTEPTEEASSPTFTFTAIPDQDTRRLEERFGAIAEYLEAELDVAVDYAPVKSYAAAVTAFVNDDVQLAWFGGLSGVQARLRVDGAQAIAQGGGRPDLSQRAHCARVHRAGSV